VPSRPGDRPVIGPVLAVSIIGKVGDIFHFPNAKVLVTYAGLDATARASGQFEGSRNRISKRGSPTLRKNPWLVAVLARRFNSEYKSLLRRKKQPG
jgi:transposase